MQRCIWQGEIFVWRQLLITASNTEGKYYFVFTRNGNQFGRPKLVSEVWRWFNEWI